MFDQILSMVKEQMNASPQASKAIPAEHADAIHHEIAGALENGVKKQASGSGGIGDLLSSLAGGGSDGASGSIAGGLVGNLTSKFGLPPAAASAIAAAIPGILQKFAHKTNDPNDKSLTPESILGSLTGGKGLGGLF